MKKVIFSETDLALARRFPFEKPQSYGSNGYSCSKAKVTREQINKLEGLGLLQLERHGSCERSYHRDHSTYVRTVK